MTRCKVILLTGFLGAGKTTLLNHLLSLPSVAARRTALIINEFSTLGVDGRLVEAGKRPVFELNKGSLFCVCIKTDLLRTLETIAEDFQAELVIIEATGVAETRDIESLIAAEHLADRFELAANVCIVDAANFTRVAPNLNAAVSQVRWADGIAINKADLVDPAELDRLGEVLTDLNADAPQTPVTFGRVPEEFLTSLTHQRRRGELAARAPQPFVSASFESDQPIDRQRFEATVAQLGEKLLRLKGQVDFGNGPQFVEVAGMQLRFAPQPVRDDAATAFAAIAWRTNRADLEAVFQACWDAF